MPRHITLLTTLAVFGCSGSSSPSLPPIVSPAKPIAGPVADAGEITIELTGVTLADGCGDRQSVPPMPAPVEFNSPCQQTSMQIILRSPTNALPTAIRVKHVELVDATGKLGSVLTTYYPSLWVTDHYVEWDEMIAPGQTLATSYHLSSPDWRKLRTSDALRHTKMFNLRVTFVVGTKEQTLEKQQRPAKERAMPGWVEPVIET